MESRVSVVRCSSYEPAPVAKTLKEAMDLFGGISAFIRPESRVLVKPNLLLATAPQSGVTTHPEVVRAVVRLLQEINCKIFLGDGPSVWGRQAENVDEVYENTGMKNICEEEGIELVNFDRRRWHKKFPLTTWIDDCNYVVSIPKFKTHDLTVLTGAIKNLFGLVWGTYKTELHKRYFNAEDFSKILVDIYEETRPALTVVDGITAMEGDGPGTGGKLREVGLILAASDCVALDSILALIMGLKPLDIPTTKEASRRGLGEADISRIKILGERLEGIYADNFRLPSTSLKKKIPQPIFNIAKKLIRFYPEVLRNNCTLCGACVQVCPQKVIKIENRRVVINYSGCISCFCCQETCPSSAIKIKRSILAQLLGL